MSAISSSVHLPRTLSSTHLPFGVDADQAEIEKAYQAALKAYNSRPVLGNLTPPFAIQYEYTDNRESTPYSLNPGSDYNPAVALIDQTFLHLLGSSTTHITISYSVQLCVWKNAESLTIWTKKYPNRIQVITPSDFLEFLRSGTLRVVFTNTLSNSDSWGETTTSNAVYLSASLARAYGTQKRAVSTGSLSAQVDKERLQILEYMLFASFLHEYAGHAFVKYLFGDQFQSPDPLNHAGAGEMGYVVELGLMGIVPVVEWDQDTVQRLQNRGQDPATINEEWLLNVDRLLAKRVYKESACYVIDMRQVELALASLKKETVNQVSLVGFDNPKPHASSIRARLSHHSWGETALDEECENDAQETEEDHALWERFWHPPRNGSLRV